MSVTSNRSYCFCCGNCSGWKQRSEFQKIVDLKDLGLSIYRYVIYPRSYRRHDAANLCGANIQFVESNEIFILHNTRNNEISPADYVLALDRNPIYCLRCRQAVRRAQRLLEHGETIGKKSVKGICEHCLSRQAHLQFHQPCVECQEVVKKFVERLAMNSALRSAALDASLKRKRQFQPKSRPSLQRHPKIEQMFLYPEDKYDERDSIWSELGGYGSKKRTTLELSGGPIEPMGKNIVTFGETPEIIERKKIPLIETIANTDDHDVETLLNYIKNALKEKKDAAGTEIPYAKWVIGKTDEELENLILQAITFAKKDSDIERHILQLIEAQETANSNLSEMRNRWQENNIELEITEPISEVTKRKQGSLEKLIHQKVMEEKGQVIKEARDVALIIRKQLDALRRKSINILGTSEYLKQERHMPPKSAKSEEDVTRFTALIKTKLQNAKKHQESKENLPPISHKLFRQKFEATVDRDLAAAYEKDLYTKTPGVLKPSRKGAQILQKSISNALDTKDDEKVGEIRDKYHITKTDDKKMEQTKKPEKYSEQMKEQKDKTYSTKTVSSEKEMKQKKGKTDITKTVESEKEIKGKKEPTGKKYSSKSITSEKEAKRTSKQKDKTYVTKTVPSEKEIQEAKKKKEQKDKSYTTKSKTSEKEMEVTPTKKTSKKEETELFKTGSSKSKEAVSVKSKPTCN